MHVRRGCDRTPSILVFVRSCSRGRSWRWATHVCPLGLDDLHLASLHWSGNQASMACISPPTYSSPTTWCTCHVIHHQEQQRPPRVDRRRSCGDPGPLVGTACAADPARKGGGYGSPGRRDHVAFVAVARASRRGDELRVARTSALEPSSRSQDHPFLGTYVQMGDLVRQHRRLPTTGGTRVVSATSGGHGHRRHLDAVQHADQASQLQLAQRQLVHGPHGNVPAATEAEVREDDERRTCVGTTELEDDSLTRHGRSRATKSGLRRQKRGGGRGDVSAACGM